MSNSNPGGQQPLDAYVDEAGAKGFLRNLDLSMDDNIAVLAAILTPQEGREQFRKALLGPFENFKAARPNGGNNLHITDAFKVGYESWGEVAKVARSQIFAHIKELKIPVIYDARRLRVARESFKRLTDLENQSRSQRRSNVRISQRPSAERVEETCMAGLALKLDAFATDSKLGMVDILTDQIDGPIAKLFKETIQRTRNISNPKEVPVTGWNPTEQKKVSGVVRIQVKGELGKPIEWLDTKHIGDLVVLGKDDPLVFAADVVVNALHHHLSSLPIDAPLNQPSSICGWELGDRVYGVRPNAIEDRI